MADQAPAAPAVSSFDPVEWTKRINKLEEWNAGLVVENRELKASVERAKSEAASARGDLKQARGRLTDIEGFLEKNEDLKELSRLRAEVAKMHSERAKSERERAQEDKEAKARLDELSARASRAEAKFQALESTATMMAQGRDRANGAAAKLLEERDQALARLAESESNVKALVEQLKVSTAELRALKVPAKAAK
jgi:chromosome segregation ATPase